MKAFKLAFFLMFAAHAFATSAQAQSAAGNWDLIEPAGGPAIGKMILARDGSINYDGMTGGTWSQSGNQVRATVYGTPRLRDAGMPPVGEINFILNGNLLRGTVYVLTQKKTYQIAARLQGSRDGAEAKPDITSGTVAGGTTRGASGSAHAASPARETAHVPTPKQGTPEPETCVLEGTGICRGGAVTKTSGGSFYVRQPNNCGYRLYATICIKTKSGREDCGSDGIKPGGTTAYWHSSDDATGQFTVTTVGVLKGGDDWSCMAAKRKLGSSG